MKQINSAWLLAVKVVRDKGGPNFLYISKGRKSETAMADKNKTYKYPVDMTCQNMSCLLLRLKSRLGKVRFQLPLNKTFFPTPDPSFIDDWSSASSSVFLTKFTISELKIKQVFHSNGNWHRSTSVGVLK